MLNQYREDIGRYTTSPTAITHTYILHHFSCVDELLRSDDNDHDDDDDGDEAFVAPPDGWILRRRGFV